MIQRIVHALLLLSALGVNGRPDCLRSMQLSSGVPAKAYTPYLTWHHSDQRAGANLRSLQVVDPDDAPAPAPVRDAYL